MSESQQMIGKRPMSGQQIISQRLFRRAPDRRQQTGGQKLLLSILDRHLQDARICFRIDDREFTVGRAAVEHGDGACDVFVRVENPRFFSRILVAGNLGLGEAYMDHDFEIEGGTLQDFLLILLRNRLDRRIKMDPLAAARILLLRLGDALRGKAHNVQRHYDIGDDLFESFLDSTLTYSCGYVKDPDDDLEQLQHNKLDRICQKLRLKEGERLLDIGCGYGGLLRHAAKHYGVTATGVTISRRHCERGNSLAAEEGLADRVKVQFTDFTSISGQYDKVVSVGMMEHVPRREYRRYFDRIARVLAPQGMGLVHTVGANAAKNTHDPFIQKYIFPNSNQPRLSEITVHLERQGLAIIDVENMIRHYGYTMREWLKRFRANRMKLDAVRYGDAFVRMWEYYLCCGVAAAFASDAALYQVLFTNDYTAPLPLHRI